ncbi:hypothetical protein D3C85_1387850 [compost metagenome]
MNGTFSSTVLRKSSILTSATVRPRFLNTSTIFFSESATSADAFSAACCATSAKIFLSSSDRLFQSLPEITVFR